MPKLINNVDIMTIDHRLDRAIRSTRKNSIETAMLSTIKDIRVLMLMMKGRRWRRFLPQWRRMDLQAGGTLPNTPKLHLPPPHSRAIVKCFSKFAAQNCPKLHLRSDFKGQYILEFLSPEHNQGMKTHLKPFKSSKNKFLMHFEILMNLIFPLKNGHFHHEYQTDN